MCNSDLWNHAFDLWQRLYESGQAYGFYVTNQWSFGPVNMH